MTVHRISGEIVEPSKALGDPDVIEALEGMLERARSGDLISLAAVYRDREGLGTYLRGAWEGRFFEAVGVIALLQYDMMSGAREGRSDEQRPDLGA
ncbi:MAG: hypothetical protein OK454_08700 [Thaumarchaeota archaeon]|nr:hypothetical protein [Nitrososphaerota archaeon]